MRNSILSRISLITLIFGFFSFSALSFATSTARMGGADEVLHHATAWYDTSHLKVTSEYNTLVDGIPLKVASWPCFLFQTDKPSDCSLVKQPDELGKMYVYNYFPLYYYFVGLGDRIGLETFPDHAWLGGRILGLLPVLLLMFYFIRRVSNGNNKYFAFLPLLLFTPEFISLTATANPNGFEIISALWFFIVLLNYLEGEDTAIWKVIFAEFLLISSRPMGVLWVVLITLLIFTYNYYSIYGVKKEIIKDTGKVGFGYKKISLMLSPLLAGGLLWVLTHPLDLIMPQMMRPQGFTPAQKFEFSTMPGFFLDSLSLIPQRLNESYFMAGYKEIFVPDFITFVTAITLISAFFFSNLTRKNIVFSLSVLFAFFIGMSLIEAHNWGKWPEFWLGRYQLPLLLPILFLLLREIGLKSKLIALLTINIFTFSSIYAAYENLARYKVGLNNWLPNSIFIAKDFLGIVTYIFITLMFLFAILITFKVNELINGWEKTIE